MFVDHDDGTLWTLLISFNASDSVFALSNTVNVCICMLAQTQHMFKHARTKTLQLPHFI